MTWAIRFGYRFEAVEVVKETAKMVFYVETSWRGEKREARGAIGGFLAWRGDEEQAKLVAEQVNAAATERDNRRIAASAWFVERRDEILAASCDTHPKDGDVEQAPLVSGAVPEGQTPNA